MKKFLLFAMTMFISTTLFMVSCKKETPATKVLPVLPVADFSFIYAYHGEVFFYGSSSSNATSYSWDFGDGAISTDHSPIHLYSKNGTYTVKLTVSNSDGSNSTNKSVTVSSVPSTMKIISLKLISYPVTKSNGSAWSGSNGYAANVYFKVTGDAPDFPTLYVQKTYFPNAVPPITHYLSPSITITNLNQFVGVVINNFNPSGTEEFVGLAGFTISSYTSGTSAYPSKIPCSYQGVSVEVGVSWQ